MVLYYLLAIIASFLLPISGVEFWPGIIVVLAAMRVGEPVRVYWLALITGLLADFLVGRTLGASAIFLLLAAAAVYLYRLRFRAGMLAFVVAILILQGVYYMLLWRWVS